MNEGGQEGCENRRPASRAGGVGLGRKLNWERVMVGKNLRKLLTGIERDNV